MSSVLSQHLHVGAWSALVLLGVATVALSRLNAVSTLVGGKRQHQVGRLPGRSAGNIADGGHGPSQPVAGTPDDSAPGGPHLTVKPRSKDGAGIHHRTEHRQIEAVSILSRLERVASDGPDRWNSVTDWLGDVMRETLHGIRQFTELASQVDLSLLVTEDGLDDLAWPTAALERRQRLLALTIALEADRDAREADAQAAVLRMSVELRDLARQTAIAEALLASWERTVRRDVIGVRAATSELRSTLHELLELNCRIALSHQQVDISAAKVRLSVEEAAHSTRTLICLAGRASATAMHAYDLTQPGWAAANSVGWWN